MSVCAHVFSFSQFANKKEQQKLNLFVSLVSSVRRSKVVRLIVLIYFRLPICHSKHCILIVPAMAFIPFPLFFDCPNSILLMIIINSHCPFGYFSHESSSACSCPLSRLHFWSPTSSPFLNLMTVWSSIVLLLFQLRSIPAMAHTH